MEVEIVTDVVTEPVTLEEVKAFCRIDADYTGDDLTLGLLISSQREVLEKHLNISFAPKVLKAEFAGYILNIPYGPVGDIVDLTNLTTDEEILSDNYELFGLQFKTIYVGAGRNAEIFYPINDVEHPFLWGGHFCNYRYLLEYNAGYEVLPKALKHALLAQIDYTYKKQGMQDGPLSPVALELSNGYSKNLVIL